MVVGGGVGGYVWGAFVRREGGWRGSRGPVGGISSVAERANWEVRSLICAAAPVASSINSLVCVCVCARARTCTAWAFCISTPTASVHHNQLGGLGQEERLRLQPEQWVCVEALLEQKGQSSSLFTSWIQRDGSQDESGRPPGSCRLSLLAAGFRAGSSSGIRDPKIHHLVAVICSAVDWRPPTLNQYFNAGSIPSRHEQVQQVESVVFFLLFCIRFLDVKRKIADENLPHWENNVIYVSWNFNSNGC